MHGRDKAHITCIDIFTEKKYEINEIVTEDILCPYVTLEEHQLLDLDKEGRITYTDKNGEKNKILVVNA